MVCYNVIRNLTFNPPEKGDINMRTTFKEIWQVFSTTKGRICGLDTISLSVIFRIAEMEIRNDPRSRAMYRNFLKHESITSKQLDDLVQEIKKNTTFDGTVVCNADGQPRYQNLPDVGFIITEEDFQTVILTEDGVERTNI